MNKYSIRFNKSRGQPGRGTFEHVWRIFENQQYEYLVKHFKLNVASESERDINGVDWNVTCYGYMTIDKETSTVTINAQDDSKQT